MSCFLAIIPVFLILEEVPQAVLKEFYNSSINIFQEKIFRHHDSYLKMWIFIQKFTFFPRNKQNHVQKISGCCVLPRFLSTLPMGFSFVYHMLPSSLPLSTVVLQHKMKGPGRPPRCHLPPQFLMRHLSYTNRFQCLIKTIHFLPHASCWKKHSFKTPFSIPTVNFHRIQHTH